MVISDDGEVEGTPTLPGQLFGCRRSFANVSESSFPRWDLCWYTSGSMINGSGGHCAGNVSATASELFAQVSPVYTLCTNHRKEKCAILLYYAEIAIMVDAHCCRRQTRYRHTINGR